MRAHYLIVLLGLGFQLVSCAKVNSDAIKDQEQIFTTWNALYDHDPQNHKIEIKSSFNVGGPAGTYLELVGISQSLVNGKIMEKDPTILNQVFYRYVLPSPTSEDLKATYRLEYINNDGRSLVNEIHFPMPPSVGLRNRSEGPISEPLIVDWESPDILKEEDLYANLFPTDQRAPMATARYVQVRGTRGSFAFTPEQLAELGPGDILVRVCRESRPTLKEVPQKGGSLTLTACSAKLRHTLVAE